MTVKSEFLKTFIERGFYNDCTNLTGLDDKMATQIVPTYLGFDLTAKSLHVGSLVQIMTLRLLQQTGHKPIILLGGATTRIGDPTGKDKAREVLSDEVIAENGHELQRVFSKFIKFGDGPTDAVMVNNYDWLGGLNYLDFLRDIGRHFSVNRMLSFESMKQRLDREQPLSFLEFNYMILQGYDFTVLQKERGCLLQIGGSDQWGNIINGVELNRKLGQGEVFGLTTPLLTTSSGKKMGKSESGAIWLNAELLSPYDYWQYFRNTEDADVEKFLKLFTELDLAEVGRLGALQGQEINEAKMILADHATRLCHGEYAATAAKETALNTFSQQKVAEASNLPTVKLKVEEAFIIPLYKIIVESGLCASAADAKRLIQQGAVKIGRELQITDIHFKLPATMVQKGEQLMISLGKKKHFMLRFQ